MDGTQQVLDGIAAIRALPLSSLSSHELVELKRTTSVLARRLAAVDLSVIAELDGRGVASEFNCTSTAALLTQLVRLDPGEATSQVRAAQRLTPRPSVTGAVIEPEYPVLADAVAVGAVSLRHASVVSATMESLPDAALDAAGRAWCEEFLTERAQEFEPATLRKIARRLVDTIDPDDTLADAAYRDRRRGLTVSQRADGSAHVDGELTPLCAEALLTCLDAAAKPAPADDGERDPRSAAQRRHDGLHDSLLVALRAGQLPASGGVSTTILISMTAEQAESRSGLAVTGHGALISVPVALALAGDAQLQTVVLSKVGAIEAYSSAQRLFTAAQRLAMAVRDGGCSVPGCTVPAAWCQAHHIVEYIRDGPTTVSNGTLVCGDHHRYFEQRGWRCTMIDGAPHWIPPPWIDPAQRPRRNTAHGPPRPAA